MSTKSKEKNKLNIIFTVVGIIGLAVLSAALIVLYSNNVKGDIPSEVTGEWVQEKVKEAVSKYDYADIQWQTSLLSSENEVLYQSEYYMYTTGKKSNAWSTYTIYDSETVYGEYLWENVESNRLTDVYMLDMELGEYVKTSATYNIISMDLWGVVDDISKYALYDEFAKLGNTEYYLFISTGEDDEGNIISDEVYINKDTFLPELIVVTADVAESAKEEAVELSEDLLNSYTQEMKNQGIDSIEDVHATVDKCSVQMLTYDLGYYKEDVARLTEPPKEFLTEQEWMAIYDTNTEGVVEEETDESGSENSNG